ncbi:MAG: Pvc16 family protein, partial [Anaerolineaceae bacterium]
MIADLDESIRQLLKLDMPIKNGEIDIVFDQPRREWSARLSKPTLNFFLYDVRENTTLRHHDMERLGNGRAGDMASLKRTPFRVDCSYIITAWAADPEDE